MEIVKVTQKNTDQVLELACKVLTAGGLVVYPTETCYGVGVDAENAAAVARLLEYKRRPEGKAVSIAVQNMTMAEQYVELNDTAKGIYQKFLPGPVTVVSHSKGKTAAGLEAEDHTLGVRIPDFPLALALLGRFGRPLTATSANSAGKKTPYSVTDILDNISAKQKQLLGLIIDAGELPHNPPSTVIDTTKETMKVLRRGGLNLSTSVLSERVSSAEVMQEQGAALIRKFRNLLGNKTLLVMFNAELGAGKTQFIKGMARELGITAVVNSPTFILMKEYDFDYHEVTGKLLHLDAWRLESVSELEKLKLQQYFKPGNVIAMEWAGMAKEYLESLGDLHGVLRVYIEIEYTSLHERSLKIYE